MTTEELARMGKAMRDAQRRYFKTRDNGAPLRESKDAERRFDKAVDAVLHPDQPDLFEAQKDPNAPQHGES